MQWQILLHGTEKARAEGHIVALLDATLDAIERSEISNRSLANGASGMAVFLHHLPEELKSPRSVRAIPRLFSHALQQPWSNFQGWSLFDGELGVYWALAHCSAEWANEDIERILSDIDQQLLAVLQSGALGDAFDLVRGLVGIGTYALERLPNQAAIECIGAVIDELRRIAVSDSRGLYWPTSPDALTPTQRHDCPSGCIDMGMAHGQAGVIAFLSIATSMGVPTHRTTPLVEGAMQWTSNESHLLNGNLRFPFYLSLPSLELSESRNAWCYGDAGVAMSLLLAANAFGRKDWEVFAGEVAHSASVCCLEESGVADSGLCHGAAGLAHIFNRLYQLTDDLSCRQAALFWLNETLEREASTTFTTAGIGESALSPTKVGLLEGQAGVGLALAAATTNDSPGWDRFLLLS